ncbi:MAG: hypothetical protein ACTSWG_13470 [Candidatus Helarchaeota archaeon]
MAKSNKWQSIYKATKECGISLFNNKEDLSGYQVRFLYWLSVYNMLYGELARHEDEWLTKAVIEDYDRTDAYLIYRNKKHDYLWKKYRREERARELEGRNPNKRKRLSSGKKTMINVDLRRE